MFERGKREDGTDERTELAASTASRGSDSSIPKAGNRGNEWAVIGRSIQINGDVRGNEDLRIEGDVSGTVELRNSNLTIGKEGKVRADVYAKSITVDGRLCLFGSLNLDPRSMRLDFEITLAVYDEEFTADVRRLQMAYLEQSPLLDLATCQARSRGQRFLENAARLAGPVL